MTRKKKSFLSKEINIPMPNKVASGKLGKSRKLRLPKYVRESIQELRKVTWPSRKEAWKLTFAVIVFSTIFTLFIVIVDNIFEKLAERVFL